MSTDRKLLEDAAKAAGYLATQFNEYGWFYVCTYPGNPPGDPAEFELWNPLTDDGDALRLAVKLGIVIDVGSVAAHAYKDGPGVVEIYGSDPYSATRRAIVRAAAATGAAK